MQSTSAEFLQDFIYTKAENNQMQFMVGYCPLSLPSYSWVEKAADDGRTRYGREICGGSDY